MSILMKTITKSFGQPATQILKGINAEIKEGEMVAITGRSGSGKSTLLYIISSLDKPTTGEVIIDSESLSQMSSQEIHKFRNLKMGFVFQFHHLLPELTAVENVLMPTLKSSPDGKRKEFAFELLKQFGILNKADSFPSQLSGGEQQRVAIARALIMRPKFLFADEPTGNLDKKNSETVFDIFHQLTKEFNQTLLIVTHDNEFASRTQRIIEMEDGRIVKQ